MVVPARDEEAGLRACLQSLVDQSEPGFALGKEWELIVVDDHSTDGTRGIAEGFAGVRVLEAPALGDGFTGKTNACWTGAQAAGGAILLFTDADTVHVQGSVSRARREMEKYGVAMVSYSPEQVVEGFWQRVLMPLVFAELAGAYPPKKVSDPESRLAAANGQFLMVEAEAYFAVGGHRGVGPLVLEDVALARNIKRGKRGIRFRYAPDAVSARMYRTTAGMVEGWTKNLALLFGNALPMAAMRSLELLLMVGIPVIALGYPFFTHVQRLLFFVVWGRGMWAFYRRTSKSNFPVVDVALSVFGLPLLIMLLVRSYLAVKVRKSVEWKGRSYSV